ncbi:MAG: hypothetical protein V3575_04060 [Candidatus Absconditabacteria bacterium]
MTCRQFNFFLFSQDILKIELYFKDKGNVVFIESGKNIENKLRISNNFISNKLDFSKVYLTKPELIENVELEFNKYHNSYYINRNSPIIEVLFSNINDNSGQLNRGRFYYQPKYFKNGEFISHDEEFIKWAETIFKDVKKMFILGKGVYYHKYGKIHKGTIEMKDYYLSEKSIEFIKNGGDLNFW